MAERKRGSREENNAAAVVGAERAEGRGKVTQQLRERGERERDDM